MRELGETGWLAMAWPASFGGQARTPFEQLAFFEEQENLPFKMSDSNCDTGARVADLGEDTQSVLDRLTKTD